MPRPNVLALTAEPLDNFEIDDDGNNMFAICTALHGPALVAHYGVHVPEPEAAVCDDGTLAIFWRMDGWPITIRIDEGMWWRFASPVS